MTSQIDTGVCLSMVQFSILFYDYALTLGEEIDLFWKQSRRSWPFVLFTVNRYVTLLNHILVLAYTFWQLPGSVCKSVTTYSNIAVCISQGTTSVLMCLRVYAIYNKSRSVMILLVILMTSVAGLALWSTISYPSSDISPASAQTIGCQSTLVITSAHLHVLAVAWGGQLMLDVVIFLLTLWKSLQSGISSHTSLINVFLRDGTMYFGVICAVSVMNLIVLLVTTNSLEAFTTYLTNVLSVVMVSRVMLNLRNPSLVTPGIHSSQLMSFECSCLEFA
ncbi:hypothetical protein SCLCIDRAFT_1214135 [Scleroderma citrinum Foug A]|uniref:DUF6533 domain-containing protein n=1 Tax=Scleroderma citrinum Foug A TaxID=1036808 RepID=A0A0C3E4W6_9AGAM|nr:hypothetical protein SCLCIDRAFT_1214135 [Scleroderma citrinum Foug A]